VAAPDGLPAAAGAGLAHRALRADEFPAYVRAERGVDGVLTGAKS
jgi:hypothetical protein